MSHIFISYSRRDLGFALKIVDALTKNGLDIWIDQEDIPKGEEWWLQIKSGIEEADAFLFLISPDSAKSKVCNDEINHAILNGKRILPVLIRDVNARDAPPEISKLNWVFCRDTQDEFDQAISIIVKTIHTDYEWLQYHARLQVKAVEWGKTEKEPSCLLNLIPNRWRLILLEGEREKKDTSRLLRGKELREAEIQLAKVNDETDPPPTELQQRYIVQSKKHERQVRQWTIGVAASAALAILGLLAWPTLSRERAIPGNWVHIPRGEFTMGMDQTEAETASSLCLEGAFESEKQNCPLAADLFTWAGPANHVNLPAFAILENEVTNAQYQQCVEVGQCKPPLEWQYAKVDVNKPATSLNWFQAGEYCAWLGGRLPTEVEWEKAASGPDDRNHYFPWGNAWDAAKANLERSGIGDVQNIAAYAGTDISGYGVKNLAGNVREWTASESIALTESQPSTNTILRLEDQSADYPVIVRGGAWINARSGGMSSMRSTDSTLMTRPTLGFRCACPANQTCQLPWDRKWIWFGKY